MDIALITGASSGFGWEIAKTMARMGNYKLIITGRRMERLEELRVLIEKDYPEVSVRCLSFDIRSENECNSAIQSLPEDWKRINVIINNAGLAAGTAFFQDSIIEDWEQMIDTNVKGVLYITRLLVPQMIERKEGGHIVNISSIAGTGVYPGGHVYCATKHALNAITKGLRIDLVKHGIKVSSVSPGMAETEFSLVRYRGDQSAADKVYEGVEALKAQDIADAVEFILSRPAHVNINDVLITPTQQADFYTVNRSK